jgi:outer membrane receptor protein involved in Fe transport
LNTHIPSGLLVFSLLAASGSAQTTPSTDELVALERFEIAADRAPAADNSALEARRLASPEPFAGITREEFGRRANRRAGDIVARLPGVYMGGPPGENKDARLRGLDKEFTRTQVDGLQLPDGGEKRELQLNRVPADLIQEVRILRNPSPEFESDGLAGRLDFRFRPIPEGRLVGEARFGIGERNRASTRTTGSLLLGGRLTPALGVLASYTYLDDPTYKIKSEQEFAPSGTLRRSIPEDERVQSTSHDFFGDVAWYYSSGELHLKPLRLDTLENKTKTKSTFDLAKAANADETRETEVERKTKLGEGLSLAHLHRFAEVGRTLDTRLSWQRVTEEKPGKFNDAFKETAAGFVLDKRTVENEDKADRTVAADTKLTLPLGAERTHVVKTGFSARTRDRFRDKIKTEAKPPALVPVDATGPKDTYFLDEDYYAAFVEDFWTIRPNLTALYGARYEFVDFASRTHATADTARTFSDFNPSAQLAWRVRPDFVFKLAGSRALNRPKFDELSPYEQVTSTKITIGNPGLEPTRAWKYDFGAELIRRDLLLAANFFLQDVTGLIETVETGQLRAGVPIVQILNVGDGWVRGLELEQHIGFRWTNLPVLSGLGLWSNQTWLRSELTEKATGNVKPFNGQPRFLANLGFDYEIGRVYFTASARYIGPRPSDDTSVDQKEVVAEYPLDAAVHFRLGRGFSLFLEANNLTDEGKDERTLKADGTRIRKIEQVGRAWFAGTRYQF